MEDDTCFTMTDTMIELKKNLLCNGLAWSKEEDSKLIKFVFNYGYNWDKCSFLFYNKSPENCKNRFIKIAKQKITLCKNCSLELKKKIKQKIMEKYFYFHLRKE